MISKKKDNYGMPFSQCLYDSNLIAFYNIWERGLPDVPPKDGDPPCSEREYKAALKRRKKRMEESERIRWAEKMKAKEERKRLREAKALAEQEALQQQPSIKRE